MDYQHPPSQKIESPLDESLEPWNEDDLSSEYLQKTASETPLRDEKRRRRSRSKSGESNSRSAKNGRSQRSKGKDKNRGSYLQSQNFIIWGCCFLTLVIVFMGGFYFGQKFGNHNEVATQPLQNEAPNPTPEAETLLDAGFTALQQGNYQEAMFNFQKAQNAQPALFGIDYLIAESAYKSGDNILADEAAGHALSKDEMTEPARVLQTLINLKKSNDSDGQSQQLADPNVTAENEIKQLVATHLGDAKAFVILGDFLRSIGSYRSAVDVLHKGIIRADPEQAMELLSAKEKLATLQNKPAVSSPSLSELTSMTSEQALIAAMAALQNHRSEDAALFLERARDLYSPQIFRELMNDIAFTDYRSDTKLKSFFKTDQH